MRFGLPRLKYRSPRDAPHGFLVLAIEDAEALGGGLEKLALLPRAGKRFKDSLKGAAGLFFKLAHHERDRLTAPTKHRRLNTATTIEPEDEARFSAVIYELSSGSAVLQAQRE